MNRRSFLAGLTSALVAPLEREQGNRVYSFPSTPTIWTPGDELVVTHSRSVLVTIPPYGAGDWRVVQIRFAGSVGLATTDP